MKFSEVFDEFGRLLSRRVDGAVCARSTMNFALGFFEDILNKNDFTIGIELCIEVDPNTKLLNCREIEYIDVHGLDSWLDVVSRLYGCEFLLGIPSEGVMYRGVTLGVGWFVSSSSDVEVLKALIEQNELAILEWFGADLSEVDRAWHKETLLL